MDRRHSFKRLVSTQFLTVFNDNLFKQSVLLLAISRAASFPEMQSWAQALFSAPFFFFAAFAGDLADKFSKRKLIIICKYAEALIMLLAATSFYLQSSSALLITVALMGTQSAFLGPAKYGAIRDYCEAGELPHANGVFQSSVLFGILLGTGCAGHLNSDVQWLLGIAMAALALIGARVATKMQPLKALQQQKTLRFSFNPFAKLAHGFIFTKQFHGLRSAIIGHAIFWLCGSWILLAWNEFLLPQSDGLYRVELSAGMWSLGLASLSIFMGLGAFLAGRNIKRELSRSTPIIGGLGMAAGLFSCAFFGNSPFSIWLSLSIASFFSGFYLIPLRSLVQLLPPAATVGSMLGINQMLDFGFILIAALIRPWLLSNQVDANGLLLIAAIIMTCSCLMLRSGLPKVIKLVDA